MKWLRKWWRAYLQAVRDEIAASRQRKTRPRRPSDDWSRRFNPATGLPMVGSVDVAGNPYGSCLNHDDERYRERFGSPDIQSPDCSSSNIVSPYYGATNHDTVCRPGNQDWHI